jgi:putative membrane protein
MKKPTAIPLGDTDAAPEPARLPRAFDAAEATAPATVDSLSDAAPAAPDLPPRRSWLVRLALWMAGLLISLGLGLAADRLIRDLFETHESLGWIGLAILAILLLALLVLFLREASALWRLRTIDHLKRRALGALASDRIEDARPVIAELRSIYDARPAMARPLADLARGEAQLFDGASAIRFAETTLMAPLDREARRLTAASARRVALVTAVSPRALIDIAFVIWESIRLGGAIARLYGARPGLWSSLRLTGAVLGHLAVTGGLVLTDGLVEQLVGQGLAARLSQRLGEGIVNGLMTARVGIAAIRVVRPLPFEAEPQPMVRDFVTELGNVMKANERA